MVRECLPAITEARAQAGRVALLYGAQFLAIGLSMPLLPIWLSARGLGAEAIGQVLAAQSMARTIGQPLLARLADRTGQLRLVMLACTALATATAAWLGGVAEGFWAILLGVAVGWLFFSPLVPLSEVLAVRVVERTGIAYGRMRLWGSLAFTLGAMLAGMLMDIWPATALIWAVTAAMALTLLSLLAQPREVMQPAAQSTSGNGITGNKSASWRALLTPGFIVFLLVSGLVQASHALLYGFAALYWTSLGHSGLVVGLLVTAGVLAEVVLFWFSGHVLARVGAVRLLLLAALLATVRWAGMAFDPPLPALFALQLLHAFSFGAAHLGAIAFIRTRAPAHLAATAQALNSSISMGLFMMAAMWASGTLYAALGARAWVAMAAMTALAVPLALWLRRLMPPEYANR